MTLDRFRVILTDMVDDILVSSCQCGKVQCQGIGRPILSGVCYCDDCQSATAVVEALNGAPKVSDPDGGNHYLTYRDDRFSCSKGADLLKAYQVSPDAATKRMVASCCNTAMFLKFSKGHWTSAYAKRFGDNAPTVEMRTQTQFRTSTLPLPDNAPSYRTFGTKLFWRLFTSRIAMLFS